MRIRSSWILWVSLALWAAPAGAVPVAQSGYVQLASIATPDAVTGGIVVVGDTIFVGQGSFGSQSVVRIDPGGTVTTLADGFASLSGGFVYDAVNDRLIVGDNGLEFSGSGTGDTLYAIANPFSSPGSVPPASSLELLPAGSIGDVADVTLDPTDPTNQTFLVTDAAGPPGALLEVDAVGGGITTLNGIPAFAAGIAADSGSDTLFLGSNDFFNSEGKVYTVALSTPGASLTELAGGLAGQFDLVLGGDGYLYGSSSADLVRIDPVTGDVEIVAAGNPDSPDFDFLGGVDEEDGVVYTLLFGASEILLFTAVPEPGTFALLAGGLLALALRRPRRRA